MGKYRSIMNTAKQGLDKIIKEHRSMVERGIYTKEHIDESIEESFGKLRKEVQDNMTSEQQILNEKMKELEEKNNQILPKVSSVDELLRRQEVELEISLMDDQAFEEYVEQTLLNDHHSFDEIRLFSELRTRGKDDVAHTIRSIRASRLERDPEYKELNHKATIYEVFRGLSNEVSYETENKEIVYNDLDKVKTQVYEK